MSTGPMLIFVDIDGTICDMKKDSDIEFLDLPVNYEGVKPYPERIKKVNDAYYSGAHITYWSARGCKSGEVKRLYDLTKKQLDEWGAKYHDLQIGNKPHFDVYICDKSHNADTWFEDKQEHMSTQEKIEEYQNKIIKSGIQTIEKHVEKNADKTEIEAIVNITGKSLSSAWNNVEKEKREENKKFKLTPM